MNFNIVYLFLFWVARLVVASVTTNQGIIRKKRSRAQRTNKNAAHVDPREVVRLRIADERTTRPPRE